MKSIYIWSSLLAAGFILSACGSSNNNNDDTTPEVTTASYMVTIKNLTYAQTFTPIVVAYHSKNTALFSVGERSTEGLELLAEGGDNSGLLLELSKDAKVTGSIGGKGHVSPGKSYSVTVEGEISECISLVSMLGNTNDAFTGVDCIDVSMMQNGEKKMLSMVTYDSGTEANSEDAKSIPGGAGGGEGFNAMRDDKDFVSVHSGVVTKDDGLMTSTLTQAHKWDNPAAFLIIERMN